MQECRARAGWECGLLPWSKEHSKQGEVGTGCHGDIKADGQVSMMKELNVRDTVMGAGPGLLPCR